jgi:hypothetical protein
MLTTDLILLWPNTSMSWDTSMGRLAGCNGPKCACVNVISLTPAKNRGTAVELSSMTFGGCFPSQPDLGETFNSLYRIPHGATEDFPSYPGAN